MTLCLVLATCAANPHVCMELCFWTQSLQETACIFELEHVITIFMCVCFEWADCTLWRQIVWKPSSWVHCDFVDAIGRNHITATKNTIDEHNMRMYKKNKHIHQVYPHIGTSKTMNVGDWPTMRTTIFTFCSITPTSKTPCAHTHPLWKQGSDPQPPRPD